MKESSTTKLLQDLSALLATILPIIQIFFARLPDAFTSLFVAQDKFVGISVITLLISYILIISYLIRPWFNWVIPFQKRSTEYEKYLTKLNQRTELRKEIVKDSSSSDEKMKKFASLLECEPVKPPMRIDQSNLAFICLFLILTNTASFVWMSFYPYYSFAGWLQSINYMLIVALSALVLTIYKKLSDNEKDWTEVRETRVQKAIDLARLSNCFSDIPQVKFISAFENMDSFPNKFHVWVDYNGQKYEIITDPRAKELTAVYPFSNH